MTETEKNLWGDVSAVERKEPNNEKNTKKVPILKEMDLKINGFLEELNNKRKEFYALGCSNEVVDKITNILLLDLRSNESLLNCNPTSIVSAMAKAAFMKLTPNTPLGECYILPRYKNTYAEFQIGYKGYLKYFRNSPLAKKVNVQMVYNNDIVEIEKGTYPKVTHKVGKMGEKREVIGYYAECISANDDHQIVEMSKDEILEMIIKNPKRYPSFHGEKKKDSPWVTDFDAMARKTVLAQCLSYMPLEIQKIIALDSSITCYIPDDLHLLEISDLKNNKYELEKKYEPELEIIQEN